ncbi:MAG: ribonuclease III domain-containing protein [Oscillospiraceae bacterium]|jgi:ribonuclease-3 family protein|nr:ribonuclease III domain-containing protein [Oscillospiraceae bacterium]
MARLAPRDVDVRTLSPLTLAFVGDGVYELMVRETLACMANRPNGDLHKLSVSMVRAEAQSAAVDKLMPILDDEEAAIYRRGRNAHTQRAGSDYHRATGLEALFGFLYLTGNIERLRVLFYTINGDNKPENPE